MKRFLRFDYSSYYPEGGPNDLTGMYESLDEAKAAVTKYEHAEILDIVTGVRLALVPPVDPKTKGRDWSQSARIWEIFPLNFPIPI